MGLINWIKQMTDKPSMEEIAAYQHKLPREVIVRHWFDKKTGYYTAKIISIDNKDLSKVLIITEDKTPAGLINMINDALLTHLDIPERIKPALPRLLPEDIDFVDRFIKEGQLVLAK